MFFEIHLLCQCQNLFCSGPRHYYDAIVVGDNDIRRFHSHAVTHNRDVGGD